MSLRGSRILVAAALLAIPSAPVPAADGSGDVWCFDQGWYPGRADGSCHPADKDLSAMLPIMALPPLDLLASALGAVSIGAPAEEVLGTDVCPLGYEALRGADGTPACPSGVRPHDLSEAATMAGRMR